MRSDIFSEGSRQLGYGSLGPTVHLFGADHWVLSRVLNGVLSGVLTGMEPGAFSGVLSGVLLVFSPAYFLECPLDSRLDAD